MWDTPAPRQQTHAAAAAPPSTHSKPACIGPVHRTKPNPTRVPWHVAQPRFPRESFVGPSSRTRWTRHPNRRFCPEKANSNGRGPPAGAGLDEHREGGTAVGGTREGGGGGCSVVRHDAGGGDDAAWLRSNPVRGLLSSPESDPFPVRFKGESIYSTCVDIW